MLEDGKNALITGIKYAGYGANKLKEKAIEDDWAGKAKAAVLKAKKEADDRGLTEEVKTTAGQIAVNLKGAAIDGAAMAKKGGAEVW